MRSLILLIGLLLLSACGSAPTTPQTPVLDPGVADETLTVRLSMQVLKEEEGVRTIGISLSNPTQVPIRSVRSWVRFDPLQFAVQDLHVEDGRFTLFAPGERTIDSAEGLVKLGAAARMPITDRDTLFATFTIRRIPVEDTPADGTQPVLSFHDWRAEGDGHTAVLSLQDEDPAAPDRGKVIHVLEAPSPLPL